MNPTAIYSKSGKGVQEASGKTSLLQRPDRALLSAIDGRATLAEVAQRVGRAFDAALEALITKLDKDGFIREVSSGIAAPAAAPVSRPGMAPAAKKPAPAAPAGDFGDLDFSAIAKPASAPSRPAAPPPRPAAPASAPPRPAAPPAPPPPPPKEQQASLAKAREEAEARAQAERDRLKAEAEAKTRAEMEAKLRAEAEQKLKEEAQAKAAAEADAKVKAAREAAIRAAAEAKARAEAEAKTKLDAERKAREETERRLEAERKAREEADRIRREAEEKARREAEELRQRLEEERKAREEAERKAKEEAERVRRELEEERKRLEAERKREEAERKREQEERAARRKREEEEAAARRKQKEEEERKAEEERAARRRQHEEEERKAEEERAARRKQREEEEAREREEAAQREAKRKQREAEDKLVQAPKPAEAPKAEATKAEATKDAFSDSLLADLASFTDRDDEDRKAKEEAESKAKAQAEQRARDEAQREAERGEKEEADRRRREDEERRRKEEEARRAREEDDRRAQEEERRKREADEIRRKAQAATAAAMAKEGKAAPESQDDIPVGEDDLDMDEVRREQAAIAKGKPQEPPPEKKKKEKALVADAGRAKLRRPGKLGKTIGMAAVALLVIGVGVVHVMPLGTADYERSATEALGRPVKIGSAKLWLFTGIEVRMQDVRIGDARIAHVNAAPSLGSLFGERKEFSRLELDGLVLPQAALGEAMFASLRSDNFRVERIVVKTLELPGPATLPKLQAEVALDAKGAMRSAAVRGPDGLVAKLAPKEGGVEVDLVAAGFTLPIAPQITLSNFAMKGMATPRGMTISDWGGGLFNGAISGTANIRWGSAWNVDGVFTVRNINAAVFAPTLLSAGTAEGTAKFSMNAADPSGLMAASHVDGNFTVSKGTLGSFDLARAIQTNGKQAGGSTQFAEMNGQGVYDRGAVALRNVTIGAGALNAGASADITQSGALSGRIVADIKTAAQTLRATLLLGGTVKDPQVRN